MSPPSRKRSAEARREELVVYEEAEEDEDTDIPRVVGLDVLVGKYQASGEQSDGLDVFHKVVDGEGPSPVFLYFARSQSEDEVSGWWFSDEVGGSKAWCFAEGSSFPPPESGWVVPTDDAIPVQGLRVIRSSSRSSPSKARRREVRSPEAQGGEPQHWGEVRSREAQGGDPQHWGDSSRRDSSQRTQEPAHYNDRDHYNGREQHNDREHYNDRRDARPHRDYGDESRDGRRRYSDRDTGGGDEAEKIRHLLVGKWYGKDPRGMRQWHRIEEVHKTLLKCHTDTEGKSETRTTRINIQGGRALWGHGLVYLEESSSKDAIAWISNKGTRWEWRWDGTR